MRYTPAVALILRNGEPITAETKAPANRRRRMENERKSKRKKGRKKARERLCEWAHHGPRRLYDLTRRHGLIIRVLRSRSCGPDASSASGSAILLAAAATYRSLPISSLIQEPTRRDRWTRRVLSYLGIYDSAVVGFQKPPGPRTSDRRGPPPTVSISFS